MKRYVISLERTPERLAAFRATNPHLEKTRHLVAVDGLTLDRSTLPIEPNLLFTKGALGCLMSHVKFWDMVIEADEPMTVFEDDAVVVDDFFDDIVNEKDDDIILWGFNFDQCLSIDVVPGLLPAIIQMPQEAFNANAAAFQRASTPLSLQGPSLNLYRLFFACGTIAYTLTPKGARRLKELCLPVRDLAVKTPLGSDWIRNMGVDITMCAAYGEMEAYAAFPPLVGSRNDKATSEVQFRR